MIILGNKMIVKFPYKVIAFDSGGVLHQTSYDKNDSCKRDIVIEEMKAMRPLLERLSEKYILVLVCNSTKKKISEMMRKSGLGIYFHKMYIAPNGHSKISRLEKVMCDFKTEKIVLLDDKYENVMEALNCDISAILVTYSELMSIF